MYVQTLFRELSSAYRETDNVTMPARTWHISPL